MLQEDWSSREAVKNVDDYVYKLTGYSAAHIG